MEQLVEILKYVTAGLAVLAPLFKLFPGIKGERHRQLEDRYRRIKLFFDEGGLERHPLLIESAFGAALGHTRLSATEIPLVLRQPKPTQFIATYLRIRDYLSPNKDGTRFELRSIAARRLLRRALVGVGVAFYVVFVLAAVWLVFYLAPKLAIASSWSSFAGTLFLALLFAAAAGYCLVEAGRLNWAVTLYVSQNEA